MGLRMLWRMNQPLWQPNAALRDAITKATKTLTPPGAAVLADMSLIRNAIDEMGAIQRRLFDEHSPIRQAQIQMAERQRRLVESVDRRIKEAMPANLRDVRDTLALENVVKNEGIPLAHVPRGEIVQELLDCPDYEARRTVLVARVSDVVADCLEILDKPLNNPDFDAIREVAIKAARALGDGHPEAAQALAVLASEQFISDNIADTYGKATTEVNKFISDSDTWFVWYYNANLPLFIVPTLYTPWRPTDGTPPPKASSRHVTVHQVTADHLNVANAVIAVMQISSLIAATRWIRDFITAHRQATFT